MKLITNFVFATISLVCLNTFAASSLDIYKSKRGSIGIGCAENQCRLMAIVGGEDKGDSTGGKCIILADVKPASDTGYEGELLTLNTPKFKYEVSPSKKRNITIEFSTYGAILISDIDDLGICSINTEIVDRYDISKKEELSTYNELVINIHENALSLYRSSKITEAIIQLKPYIEGNDWALSKNNPEISRILRAANDYAFFILEHGETLSAIEILHKVLSINPERKSALINLGDAYFKLGKNDTAIEQYSKYYSLMKASEKEHLIPKRVLNILNTNRSENERNNQPAHNSTNTQ